MSQRFFLDTDNDSHWFIIPAEKRDEWNDFLRIPSDEELSWIVPVWAEPLGTAPNFVTFENPETA